MINGVPFHSNNPCEFIKQPHSRFLRVYLIVSVKPLSQIRKRKWYDDFFLVVDRSKVYTDIDP